MSLHPAAPKGLDEHVEAIAQTLQTISGLAHGARPADFALPTDCPGWSVQDVLAHVIGLEHYFATGENPDVPVAHLTHVGSPMAEFVERSVEARRGQSPEAILEELDTLLPQAIAAMRDPALTAEDRIVGLFGPTTRIAFLQTRLFDLWVHEQDLREALGRIGGQDTGGAAHFVRTLSAALPMIVGKRTHVPTGHAVILELTGPIEGRSGVLVADVDGSRRGLPLFTGEEHDHDPAATTTIRLSTQVAGRLGAGRRTRQELHHDVHGDEAVAADVLDHLNLAP
ncbi:maleylpyruvate isomerase family mycothiol-dependent enzyme [Janibacter sp. G1551]|uniref:maleylpyruvate isomerase family mycothiol-dependent enzyme n=1 Tax=Janibacter sp. G1551 TaxID=3420440 RepID=UPI003D02EB6C